MLQIKSATYPFDRPEVGRAAARLLAQADAMGLLPEDEAIEALDWRTVQKVMRRIADAGIARNRILALRETLDPSALAKLLDQIRSTLEENPLPDHELPRLLALFPVEELAPLLGVSVSSIHRYRAHTRRTPLAVAERLHVVARIISFLEGAYDELGIRRWFQRKREALGGRSPSQILSGDWESEGKDAASVVELARSLTGSPAT